VATPRIWQYRVTEVGGCMIGRIDVGDLTLDRWHGHSHSYNIGEPGKGITGFYSVRLEGEAPEEQAEQLRANWRNARQRGTA
jgi:hypothetical protein